MQADPLPGKREHVCVHLPHMSYEHGPLAGSHKALYVSENENQALPAGSTAGGLGDGVRPVVADAILPQVILKYYLYKCFLFVSKGKKIQEPIKMFFPNKEQ